MPQYELSIDEELVAQGERLLSLEGRTFPTIVVQWESHVLGQTWLTTLLLDYTIPVVSLVKAGRITGSIEELLHGLDIEDLWLPYVCVSTNLTQSRLEVHRRGDAATAVRASVAIPGVLQ